MAQSRVQQKGTSYENPVEAFKDMGDSIVGETTSIVSEVGKSFIDALYGNTSSSETSKESFENLENNFNYKSEYHRSFELQEKGQIFSLEQTQELQQIDQLTEVVRKEVKMLVQSDRSMMSQVKDLEKLTINSGAGNKEGIYHIRFLEVVISLLRMLRVKVNESRSWLESANNFKQQKGFFANKKKHGKKYTNSDEHSVVRATG